MQKSHRPFYCTYVPYKEDVVVARDGSLAQHSVVGLPTTKHSGHVFTDGNSERLTQSNLGWGRGGEMNSYYRGIPQLKYVQTTPYTTCSSKS